MNCFILKADEKQDQNVKLSCGIALKTERENPIYKAVSHKMLFAILRGIFLHVTMVIDLLMGKLGVNVIVIFIKLLLLLHYMYNFGTV